MLCEKCNEPVLETEGFVHEDVNEAEATTSIKRYFCLKCGTLYKPTHSTYMLVIHRMDGLNPENYAVLEKGDTFSQVWVTLPLYRTLFQSVKGEFIIRILSKTIDEPLKKKLKYEEVYEEVVVKPEMNIELQ